MLAPTFKVVYQFIMVLVWICKDSELAAHTRGHRTYFGLRARSELPERNPEIAYSYSRSRKVGTTLKLGSTRNAASCVLFQLSALVGSILWC